MTEDELLEVIKGATTGMCGMSDSSDVVLELAAEIRRLNAVVADLTRERDIAVRRADWKR